MDTPLGLTTTLTIFASFAIIFYIVSKAIESKKDKKEEVHLQHSGNSSTSVSANVDADVIPVIAAAVHVLFEENVVIRKITFAHDVQETSWTYLARAKNFYSRDNIQKTRTIYGK